MIGFGGRGSTVEVFTVHYRDTSCVVSTRRAHQFTTDSEENASHMSTLNRGRHERINGFTTVTIELPERSQGPKRTPRSSQRHLRRPTRCAPQMKDSSSSDSK